MSSFSERIYDWLLRALVIRTDPEAMAEMREIFRDAHRDARRSRRFLGRTRLWTLALLDLAVTVRALSKSKRAGRSHQSRSPGTRHMLDALANDAHYAFRKLTRERGFAVAAILTLALGIAANTAIFSLVNSVLLQPLSYAEPSRLVLLDEITEDGDQMSVSYPNFVDWQQQSRAFESLGALLHSFSNLTGDDQPELIVTVQATHELLPLLGIEPLHGRAFDGEDDRIGAPQVTLLTHGLFERRFGSDPAIVGETIVLDGSPVTVIGVLPPGFPYPPFSNECELVLPLRRYSESFAEIRGRHPGIYAIGKLATGITLQQAADEMDGIAARLAEEYPNTNGGVGVRTRPLHEVIVEDARPTLIIVWAAVGAVLLIACTNIAGLLVARAAARQREVAIRRALGAGRARLAFQLMTESVMLALCGGAVGLLLATWGVGTLAAAYPGELPRLEGAEIDVSVLAFTGLIAVVSGILAGLAPALEATRSNVNRSLQETVQGPLAPSRQRARSVLVVLQLAVSLVLLIAAGMLARSLWRIISEGPGFDPDNLVTVQTALPQNDYPEQAQQVAFFTELLDGVQALPGVDAAAVARPMPLSGGRSSYTFYVIAGEPEPDTSRQRPPVEYVEVSPGYFRTLGIRLLRGRGFEESDRLEAPHVAVVDELFAQRHFGAGDAIGRRLKLGTMNADSGIPWLEVVGVVGHVTSNGVTGEQNPQVYVPYMQGYRPSSMTLVIRATNEPEALVGLVRRQLGELDPALPLYNIATANEYLAESNARHRFAALLVGAFAAAALLLASIGIYGVTAFLVTRRTREIGIRMALGARTTDVLQLLAGEWAILAAAGAGLGLLASLVVTRHLGALLYEIQPLDPISYLLGAGFLLFVSLLAALIPSRRATRIDPQTALRES
jgi:putative ABC transport system permease protein